MTDVAIRARQLGKRYRIGARRQRPKGRMAALRQTILGPFDYLRATLRNPTAEETLWALRDVSLEIARGEVVALIGRNGAGKSTLLKILSRITEPTEGHAELHGRVGSLLEVGTGFHKELTGRENVYMNAAILGMTRAEIRRKFDEIVAFAGVEPFIDTPVKRYSSGMHVRLGFAVAAHLEPEILLVDEVLAVGDADFQKRCLGKMGAVAKEGRTVVFVSHNMRAVATLCERAYLLDGGRVTAEGPTDSVVDEYLMGGHREQLEQTWSRPEEAPGNDIVRLSRVAVEPDLEAPGDPITIHTAIDITVGVWCLQPERLAIRLFVKGIGGETVFAVTGPNLSLQPGYAEFTCHIPGDFMNDGDYTLLVEVLKELRSCYVLDEAATFQIQELEREGTWFGKWPGAVRPRLEWDHRLEADS